MTSRIFKIVLFTSTKAKVIGNIVIDFEYDYLSFPIKTI